MAKTTMVSPPELAPDVAAGGFVRVIECPMEPLNEANRFRGHVEFQLPAALRPPLVALTEALDKRQAKLKSGLRVTRLSHAAQWLVEQLAD